MEIETAASPCGSVWSACLKSTGSDGVGAGGADEHQLNPNLSQRPSGSCGLGAAGNGGAGAPVVARSTHRADRVSPGSADLSCARAEGERGWAGWGEVGWGGLGRAGLE